MGDERNIRTSNLIGTLPEKEAGFGCHDDAEIVLLYVVREAHCNAICDSAVSQPVEGHAAKLSLHKLVSPAVIRHLEEVFGRPIAAWPGS
ncbi:MAG: hypothetical protein WAM82_20615 [Thermoanaerobaculia bacterium]